MPGRDIIVVGGSAGGVEALCQLVHGLEPGLPASLFVVCHFPSEAHSFLPEILSRQGPLLARHARDEETIYPAHIYVAPPDHHLLLEVRRIRVQRGPRENGFRPSIDPLFRSAAGVFGDRVIAVLLSGALFDGIAGLLAVRAAGGVSVIQDPQDAMLGSLPRSACQIAGADHVVAAQELGPLLNRLVHRHPGPEGSPPVKDPKDPVEKITETVQQDMDGQTWDGRRGTVSIFTCPECGGCMWQLEDTGLVRFRCHVGHAYLAEALLEEQAAALEAALWTAVRTFRECGVLARQLANRKREEGLGTSAQRFEEEARVADHYGDLIQNLLLQGLRPHSGDKAPASGDCG
jgi:two-component system chemotaxis response regulator CheB